MKIRITLIWILLSAGIAQADFGFSINGDDSVTETSLGSNETLNIAVNLLDGSSTSGFDLSIEIDNGNGGSLDSSQITFPTSFDLPTVVLPGSTPQKFNISGGNMFSPAVNGHAVIADNVIFTAGNPGEVVVLRLISQDGTPGGTLLDTVNIEVTSETTSFTIEKVVVKAGKDRGTPSDAIILLGTITGGPDNFDGIENLDIQVGSDAVVFDDLDRTIVIHSDPDVKLTARKGVTNKLKYLNSAGTTTLITVDLATGKFFLVARAINLTGLNGSLSVDLSLDDFEVSSEVDEDIINGSKKFASLCLLSGHTDALRIKSAKVGKKADTLKIQGEIAGDADNQNADLAAIPVTIRWGDVDFVIPAEKFIDKKNSGKFTVKKLELPGNGAILTATIDLQKCTFKISVRNSPTLMNSGIVSFVIEFGDFNQLIILTL